MRLPLLVTMARERRLEDELFLGTLVADEAKHAQFFQRVLDEVCRATGDLQRYQQHDGEPGSLTITGEVLDCYLADEILSALEEEGIPERLGVEPRLRLTCVELRGRIVVQPKL
jgi:ribonucleoside-diphosphate reductase beta chain